MSTTSPNFAFVLATTSDVVSVTSHVSNNFSTLDGILSIVHTGSGQLKNGLTFVSPTLNSPVFSGTATGPVIVTTTGKFNTITATGGLLTINTLTVGTYGFPSVAGSDSTVLAFQTGNLVAMAQSPNTGANQALSNLASVALNTGIGTGSGGFFTFARVVATSGSLTGLTVFQATTGTFAGNVGITGTLTANVVNCTGGAITAGSITIGTLAYPSVLGSTGQILRVSASTLGFTTPVMTSLVAFSLGTLNADQVLANATNTPITFSVENFDPGGNVTTSSFTAPVSGTYEFSFGVAISGTLQGALGILINTTEHALLTVPISSGVTINLYAASYINTVSNGAVVSVYYTGAGRTINIAGTIGNGYFIGKRLFEF